MKKTDENKSIVRRSAALFEKFARSLIFADAALASEAAAINSKRFFVGSLLMIPLSVVLIAVCILRTDLNTPGANLWRLSSIASYSLLLAVAAIVALLFHPRRKKPLSPRAARITQVGVITLMFVVSAFVVSYDQLVTNGIMSYVVLCVVVGALFLQNPALSFPLFIAAYAAFFFAAGWQTQDAHVLLSNRLSGFVAVALGFALSVLSWRGFAESVEQRQCIERQKNVLEKISVTDSLTGLSNRRFFNELAQKELASMQDSGRATCLIVIDIDNFKIINEEHGHPFGDAILRQFAYLLQDELRAGDTVSRIGGEEFVILLGGSTIEQAAAIAERLRAKVEAHPFAVGPSVQHITASFGVALLSTAEKKGFLQSHSLADKAMRLAKLNGKNRVEVIED